MSKEKYAFVLKPREDGTLTATLPRGVYETDFYAVLIPEKDRDPNPVLGCLPKGPIAVRLLI